jgi:hypothetical protein
MTAAGAATARHSGAVPKFRIAVAGGDIKNTCAIAANFLKRDAAERFEKELIIV